MKKFISMALPCALLALTACGGANRESLDKAFAEKAASQISNNQLDSLRLVYPDAAKADSLSLKYNPEQLKITPVENEEGTFTVELAQGKSIKVKGTEDGSYKILESTGIFAWPEKTIEKAKSYGMIDGKANDAELAKRILLIDSVADFAYNDYLKNSGVNISIGKRVITKDSAYAMDTGYGYYVLHNNSDKDVTPADYTVSVRYSYIGMGGDSRTTRIERGIPIKAHGTANYKIMFTGHDNMSVVKINSKAKTRAQFDAEYKPTGKEYSNYIGK